ncbi:MAG: AI-2E family transporter [Anaerolineae bacterium]
MRRLAWYTTVVLSTVAVVWLLWQVRAEIALFLFSLAVAAAVRPAINYLNSKYGLSPGLALALTYVAGLALLGGLFYLLGGLFLGEVGQAATGLASTFEWVRTSWAQGGAFQRMVAGWLPAPTELYQGLAGEQGLVLFETLFGFTSNLFGTLVQIMVVLVLSVYWSADRARFERLWLSLLPAEQRVQAREVWRKIEEGVGAYIRNEAVQGFLIGLLLGLGYWGLGLQFPITLALVAVVASLIPLIGGVLAVAAPLAISLATQPSLAVAASVGTLAVFLLLKVTVEPHLFDQQRYSSLLLVLGMILLAYDFGLLGLILAPPLMVAIQIFFGHFMRQAIVGLVAKPALAVADLQQRLENVKSMVSEMEESPAVETTGMLNRLDRLIEKADQTVPAETPSPFAPTPTSAPTGAK